MRISLNTQRNYTKLTSNTIKSRNIVNRLTSRNQEEHQPRQSWPKSSTRLPKLAGATIAYPGLFAQALSTTSTITAHILTTTS